MIIKLNNLFVLHFLLQISTYILVTMADDITFNDQQINIASNFLMKLAFQNASKACHNQRLLTELKQDLVPRKCLYSSIICYSYSREYLT